MNFPAKVFITEEGPREGFQIEAKPIPTEQKIRLIDALSETGVKSIVTVAFVNPKRVPGMADVDEVVKGHRRAPGVTYPAICLNEAGVRRAIATQRVDVPGALYLVASDAFLLRNQNCTFEESVEIQRGMAQIYVDHGIRLDSGVVAAAFGCNYEGDVAFDRVLRLIEMHEQLAEGVGEKLTKVTLADTMAWATPYAIKQKVAQVQERFPHLAITLHLHDTRGLGMANAYAGLETGVASFDAAVGGLGGCPFAGHRGAAGNICTEELVLLCDELGIETGINLDALIECTLLAEEIVGRPLPSAVARGGSLQALREKIARKEIA